MKHQQNVCRSLMVLLECYWCIVITQIKYKGDISASLPACLGYNTLKPLLSHLQCSPCIQAFCSSLTRSLPALPCVRASAEL